jgi:hypothetical protein
MHLSLQAVSILLNAIEPYPEEVAASIIDRECDITSAHHDRERTIHLANHSMRRGTVFAYTPLWPRGG